MTLDLNVQRNSGKVYEHKINKLKQCTETKMHYKGLREVAKIKTGQRDFHSHILKRNSEKM